MAEQFNGVLVVDVTLSGNISTIQEKVGVLLEAMRNKTIIFAHNRETVNPNLEEAYSFELVSVAKSNSGYMASITENIYTAQTLDDYPTCTMS